MLEQVLFGVVIPAVAAAAVLCVGWRPWRRVMRIEGGHWSMPLALMVAFVLSFASKNWPSLSTDAEPADSYMELYGPEPSADEERSYATRWIEGTIDAFKPELNRDWIVYLALAAGVVGVITALARKPSWLPWLAGPILAGTAGWLIYPIAGATYHLGDRLGMIVAVIACWFLMEPLAARRPGASLPVVFMIVLTGMSIFIMLTGGIGASMALVCGALCATCGFAMVASWLNPSVTMARGGAGFLATIVATLVLLQAWWTPEAIGVWPYLLPLGAFGLVWVGEWKVVTGRSAWVGVLVRATLAAIPVAIALIWAMMEMSPGSASGT